MVDFVVELIAGYIYAWEVGALEWGECTINSNKNVIIKIKDIKLRTPV